MNSIRIIDTACHMNSIGPKIKKYWNPLRTYEVKFWNFSGLLFLDNLLHDINSFCIQLSTQLNYNWNKTIMQNCFNSADHGHKILFTIHDSLWNSDNKHLAIFLQWCRSIWQTNLHLSDKAFSVAGPRMRNSLPTSIHSAVTKITFCKHLKTHLFRVSYGRLSYFHWGFIYRFYYRAMLAQSAVMWQ